MKTTRRRLGIVVLCGALGCLSVLFGTEVVGQQALDFGDAPDPHHRTLLAQDGARHVIDGMHYLGSRVDGESDGNPSVTASGDDLSGPLDDEDGVWFTSSLNPGNTAFLIVEASTRGYLDAWVDADADGRWTGEQIFIAQPLGKGFNTLSFTVPNVYSEGTTFSRFRFSSAGFLPPAGVAADGEVEDHWVRILTAFTVVLKTDSISYVLDQDATITFYLSESARVILTEDRAGEDSRLLWAGTVASGTHRLQRVPITQHVGKGTLALVAVASSGSSTLVKTPFEVRRP